jgi:hypothetical protein
MVNDKKDHIIDSRKQGKEIVFLDILPCLPPISCIGYEFGFRFSLNWIEFHNQFQLVLIWKV